MRSYIASNKDQSSSQVRQKQGAQMVDPSPSSIMLVILGFWIVLEEYFQREGSLMQVIQQSVCNDMS